MTLKHHQMMIDDGLPACFCRQPGDRKPQRRERKRLASADPIEQSQAALRAAQRAIANTKAKSKRAQNKRRAELAAQSKTIPANAKWDSRRCAWVEAS